MTEQPSQSTQYRDDYADLAHYVVRLGPSEEGIAQVLAVPVYAIYAWVETKPEFAAALERGWVEFRLRPPHPPSRYKYPAYTYALQLAARIKDAERVLRAKMAEMKAIGPTPWPRSTMRSGRMPWRSSPCAEFRSEWGMSEKRPVGRPRVLTQPPKTEICERTIDGETIRQIAAEAHMADAERSTGHWPPRTKKSFASSTHARRNSSSIA
jgi:hypothetical protein